MVRASSAIAARATHSVVAGNEVDLEARADASTGEDRYGIQLVSGDRNSISENHIRRTRSIAILVTDGERQRMVDNAIKCRRLVSGIVVVGSMNPKLRGNRIDGCLSGVVTRDGSGGGRFVENEIVRSGAAGMTIRSGRNVIKGIEFRNRAG